MTEYRKVHLDWSCRDAEVTVEQYLGCPARAIVVAGDPYERGAPGELTAKELRDFAAALTEAADILEGRKHE